MKAQKEEREDSQREGGQARKVKELARRRGLTAAALTEGSSRIRAEQSPWI